jgi:hypothetical protein
VLHKVSLALCDDPCERWAVAHLADGCLQRCHCPPLRLLQNHTELLGER